MSTIDQTRLDANWRAVTAELDAPRPGRVERSLRRIGLPASITRVAVSTPALRRAWYLAVAGAVLVGLGAARPDDPASLFSLLVLAPVLPVLGVAMAYGPAADPMYEVTLATPARGLRLVAVRAVVVVSMAALVITPLAALEPASRSMAAAWLLPALGLTAASLATMTWLAPRRAAAAVAMTWVVGVVVARNVTGEALAAFGLAGQVVAIVAAIGGGAIASARRATFDRFAAGSVGRA